MAQHSIVSFGLIAVSALIVICILPVYAQDNDINQNTALKPHILYAPNGPSAESEKMMANYHKQQREVKERYEFMSNRWTATARSGSGLVRGQPTIISWSIVPDGTVMASPIGEPKANSNLTAFLTSIFGSSYIQWVQNALNMWSYSSGITFYHEPNDDGAPLNFDGSYNGEAGVRGDMRLGGHKIDGNYGILAYTFSPNIGDMVIDTSDDFYTQETAYASNVISHESGHGFGLAHTCPMDNTKLMEPLLSTNFFGPQHDDIRGAMRYYGDILEPNNAISQAHNIGSSDNGISYHNLSIDDISDKDFFTFNVQSKTDVTITVSPIGLTYLEGPQAGNGSCLSIQETSQNSLAILDLAMTVYSSSGAVIQTIYATGAGSGVSFQSTLSASTSYYVQVFTSTTSSSASQIVQLYSISISGVAVANAPTPTPAASQTSAPSISASHSFVPLAPSISASHSFIPLSPSPAASPVPTPAAKVCPNLVMSAMNITNGEGKVIMNCQCYPVSG